MHEWHYLDDTELMQLMEETEKDLPCRAPDYLKNQILKKTADKIPEASRTALWIFSAKVIAAAAASIAFLLVMPSAPPDSAPQSTAVQEDSLLNLFSRKSSQFCNFLSETTNAFF